MTTPKTPYDDIDAWDTQEEARLFNRIEGYRRWINRAESPLPVVRPSAGVVRVRESDLNAFMGGRN